MDQSPFALMDSHQAATVLSAIHEAIQPEPTSIINPTISDKTAESEILLMSKSAALVASWGNTLEEMMRIPAFAVSRAQDDLPPTLVPTPSNNTASPLPPTTNTTLRSFFTQHNTAASPASSGSTRGNIIVFARNPSTVLDDRPVTSSDSSTPTGPIQWNVTEIVPMPDNEVHSLSKLILSSHVMQTRAASFETYLRRVLALIQSPSIKDPLLSGNEPSFRVELSDALWQAIASLAESGQTLQQHVVPWRRLLHPDDSPAAHYGTFNPSNSGICLRNPANHQPPKPEEFNTTLKTLVACLEGLSQFFYGHSTRGEGDITLAELLKKLLNDKSFFLRDRLGKALKPGFQESRPAAALVPGAVTDTTRPPVDPSGLSIQPAASNPGPHVEDIAGIEDTLTAIIESDSNDDLGWLPALVKTLLNNLSAFVFAVTELRRFFHGTHLSAATVWRPTAFVISGRNAPVIHLSQDQVNHIQAWLTSALPSPVSSMVKLERLYKNLSTVGLSAHYHCEAILMALMRQAIDPQPLCSITGCTHFDGRCLLFRQVSKSLPLSGALSHTFPLAVCPKKACAHCAFSALFAHPFVVNTDGSHGLLFKTQHFALPDAVERGFAELLLNSITSGEHGMGTHQSSPNRSVHQYTPPGFSSDFETIFSLRLAAAQPRPATPSQEP
ncbi:hypothetical protein CALCODRAFT_506218 [Calocera cornea HHB12733]|uniref:Uncharacterized protein n=1 Tax=Calocera cornea HHB12733 TaxID=1353952 RepID=A0A165J665_9BASI|nr:hypothetical protein CALCODRAFT_506218 [Calocera cornea HHB12733]